MTSDTSQHAIDCERDIFTDGVVLAGSYQPRHRIQQAIDAAIAKLQESNNEVILALGKRAEQAEASAQEYLEHTDKVIDLLGAKLEKTEAVCAEKDEALKSVLAHRKEDKNGNYVMWIGETTFLICKSALSSTCGSNYVPMKDVKPLLDLCADNRLEYHRRYTDFLTKHGDKLHP